MREVVTVRAGSCERCPHESYAWGERECGSPQVPREKANIYTYQAEGDSSRHRDCPYGHRVITVVMTDEEGEG